jgi:hypothetical protein
MAPALDPVALRTHGPVLTFGIDYGRRPVLRLRTVLTEPVTYG